MRPAPLRRIRERTFWEGLHSRKFRRICSTTAGNLDLGDGAQVQRKVVELTLLPIEYRLGRENHSTDEPGLRDVSANEWMLHFYSRAKF